MVSELVMKSTIKCTKLSENNDQRYYVNNATDNLKKIIGVAKNTLGKRHNVSEKDISVFTNHSKPRAQRKRSQSVK